MNLALHSLEGHAPHDSTKGIKEDEKERLIKWSFECILKDVILTKEGHDVDALGVRNWVELKGYVKQAFINANNIPKAQGLH